MKYLTTIPATAPLDRVVVHNNVRPQPVLGANGFRAWLDRPGEHLVICECPWAPGLPAHYRIRARA